MDVQVQSLIDKIKKEGVAAAEEDAAKIIEDAKKEADRITREAEAKADTTLKTAKAESERMEKSSEDAIKQAGRNILLSFRDAMGAELGAIVKDETAKAYSPDLLKTLLPEVVKAWAAKPESEDITVLLSKKDLDALEAGLKGALKAEIAKGLTLKASGDIGGGFRIAEKDGAAYYDFTAEGASDLFAAYLNPKVASLMKDAAASL
jgi:V/A-type H+-transporting ATPase subunit E